MIVIVIFPHFSHRTKSDTRLAKKVVCFWLGQFHFLSPFVVNTVEILRFRSFFWYGSVMSSYVFAMHWTHFFHALIIVLTWESRKWSLVPRETSYALHVDTSIPHKKTFNFCFHLSDAFGHLLCLWQSFAGTQKYWQKIDVFFGIGKICSGNHHGIINCNDLVDVSMIISLLDAFIDDHCSLGTIKVLIIK